MYFQSFGLNNSGINVLNELVELLNRVIEQFNYLKIELN